MSKEELNVFLKRLGTSARKKDRALSVYKVHQWNPSESRHWSFPSRSLSLNKPFSFISGPGFTEANKALEHLQKTSENGQYCQRTRTKKRWETNFQWTDEETVPQRWAGTGREQQSRTTTKKDLVLPRSIFGRGGRGNQRQLTPTILYLWKIHEGVEYFEPNRSRLESLPRRFWRWIRR